MEEESKKYYLAPQRDRHPPKVFRKKQHVYNRQKGLRNPRPTKASLDQKNAVFHYQDSKKWSSKGRTHSQSPREIPNSKPIEAPKQEQSPYQNPSTLKKPINIYYSEHDNLAAWVAQKKMNALELDRYIEQSKDIPADYIGYIDGWLKSTASPPDGSNRETDPTDIGPTDPAVKSPPEDLDKDSTLPNSISIDSNDAEVVAKGTNPFAQYLGDETSCEKNQDGRNPDKQIALFDQRLQFHVAVPECCLTDAVFKMDRPHDAVEPGEKLPPMSFENICTVGANIQIFVTEVYGPFHFWFNLSNEMHDTRHLRDMNSDIALFYNQSSSKSADYDYPITPYFLKEGYICAASKNSAWRRARIVATPPPNSDIVSVYYMDFGCGEDVSPKNLKFLPRSFAHEPAFAFRGSLSHVHPLGRHWPPDTISHFRQLVEDREIHAIVDEVDSQNGVVSMRLSHDKDFAPSLNRLLVEAGLAGRSHHFGKDDIDYNGGRRIRYLRERLPSFEMLESRLYPMNDEEFEDIFDEIVYAPSFHSSYEVPPMHNPFHATLREALVAWMQSYREEQESWIKKYKDSLRESMRRNDKEEAEKKGLKMEDTENKATKMEEAEKKETKIDEAEKKEIKLKEPEKNEIKMEKVEKKVIKMQEAKNERKEMLEQKITKELEAQRKKREPSFPFQKTRTWRRKK